MPVPLPVVLLRVLELPLEVMPLEPVPLLVVTLQVLVPRLVVMLPVPVPPLATKPPRRLATTSNYSPKPSMAQPLLLSSKTGLPTDVSPPLPNAITSMVILTTLSAFTVEGSTFLNAGAAIGRSCDVQKNKW
jgi:hypothetical protein